MSAEVLTLPCGRSRHGACSGGVTVGFGTFRRAHRCICSCHRAGPRRADAVLHLTAVAQVHPDLTPVA